jgi:hypothetical protein
MRFPLRRLVFGATALAALGIWTACGGSDAVVADTDAGGFAEVDSAVPPVATVEPKDSAPPTPPAPVYDAGEPNLIDGGDAFEGGIPCVVGGEGEIEPNNDTASANELHPTRCGAVLVSDGGADGGESDYLTFTLGDASTNFYLQYAGNVKLKVETDGQAPVDMAAPDASLVLQHGQPYFVEVRSATGKSQTWRVTLFQKP